MSDIRFRAVQIAVLLSAMAGGMPAVLSSAAAAAPQAGRQYAQLWSNENQQDIDAESRRLGRSLEDDSGRAHNQRVAGLFGKSDDEIAAEQAAQQREDAQDADIRAARQKVSDLEQTVQRLTGQMERLSHQVEELKAQSARAQRDMEYRLCTIAAQQLGASGDQQGGLDCGAQQGSPGASQAGGYATSPPQPLTPYNSGNNTNGGADTYDRHAYGGNSSDNDNGDSYDGGGGRPDTTDNSTHLAPPPGVLGTLSPQDLHDQPPPERVSNTYNAPRNIVPDNSAGQRASYEPSPPPAAAGANGQYPNGQYNAAMKLLARARYDEARSAFRGFADSNPSDPLAPQALYWVGDIAYVQKDYTNAARAFAENIKKYPTSKRAPDSMLKLGQSLIAMGQKQEGCTTLGALKAKYPSASQSVLAQAKTDRKASCR